MLLSLADLLTLHEKYTRLVEMEDSAQSLNAGNPYYDRRTLPALEDRLNQITDELYRRFFNDDPKLAYWLGFEETY